MGAMRGSLVVSAVLAALGQGCGAGGSGTQAAAAACCDDANACTVDTCASGGACSWAYGADVADALLAGTLTPGVSLLPYVSLPMYCPAGPAPACNVAVDFGAAAPTFAQTGPSTFAVSATVAVTVTDYPVDLPVAGTCSISIASPGGGGVPVGVAATVDVAASPGNAVSATVAVDTSAITASDLTLSGGVGCSAGNLGIAPFAALVRDAVSGGVGDTLQAQLCAMGPACPAGSTPVNGVCMVGAACAFRGWAPGSGLLRPAACAR